MTDVVETPAAEAPATADNARRGRPRPEVTIERDQKVSDALNTPKTRAQLTEELGLDGKQVYLSLYRLQHAGVITRTREGSNHVWTKTAAV